MLNFFKKVLTQVVGENSTKDEELDDESEIINNINSLNLGNESTDDDSDEEPEGKARPPRIENLFKLKLIHKTGKVTFLNEEYGLIDKVIHFAPSQVSSEISIKQNDEVHYTAYKAKENESDRVYKIYALKKNDPEWEDEAAPPKDDEESKNSHILAINKDFPGRVTKRRNREVFIEELNTWCNLDLIKTTFVPIEGDWVTVHATTSIDPEVVNLIGEIVEIKAIRPLIKKTGFGRVTLWSALKKEGAIENYIFFSELECKNGYGPSLGDQVVYDAIESDQDTFKWRALVVFPCDKKPNTQLENKLTTGMTDSVNAYQNKNGVFVEPSVCAIEMEMNETRMISFTITNKNAFPQVLKNIQTSTRLNRQMWIVKPPNRNYVIKPNQPLKVFFTCKGNFLGMSGETCIFRFEDFIIARKIEMNVLTSQEMKDVMACKYDKIVNVFQKGNQTEVEKEPALRLYGPKVWQPPKFICKERKCRFVLPQKLKKIAEQNLRGAKKLKAVEAYAPYLKFDMNFTYYDSRFHTFLYLEELELQMNFRRYDLKGVHLTRVEDCFSLEVPGLVERRPSVIIGDSIALTQPWSETDVEHIGYIHKILQGEVLIKFHNSFHNFYDESQCNVRFIPNTFFFARCHEAITRAGKVLGEQWLFPSAVNEKPPRIQFDIDDFDEVSEKEPSSPPSQTDESVTKTDETSKKPKKKLPIWFNKDLNKRQKLAVVNVLKGQGRPLPYIIFGPPGTGKTVTLVEIILQIYILLPSSRILVATPSNSAADLICNRLIEMVGIRPGELVRLAAITRILEGVIPVNLRPYTTYYRNHDSHSDPYKDNENVRLCALNELTGKHRITVATCTNVGRLHFSGFPPGHFTHILVDEAGQTIEPEVLIAATFQDTKTGQIVLAGDPEQLGPVVCSSIAKSFGFGESLLQRFIRAFPYAKDMKSFPDTSGFDPRFVTRLNVNYRTVPEILSLVSQMFYNSDLIPTISQTEGEEAEIIKKFNFLGEGRETPASLIFHGIIGQNYQESDSPSWFNPHEIWQVVLYLKQLYAIGLKQSDVGILTPYAKQVQKLNILLDSLNLAIPKVGTVEEYQGQENKVVILSTVRSSLKLLETDISHNLGFVACPKRLNVSLSRARALLIIIGNPILLSHDPYWVTVIKYCIKNKSYTGCNYKYFNYNLELALTEHDPKNDDDEKVEEEEEEEEKQEKEEEEKEEKEKKEKKEENEENKKGKDET